MMTQTQLEFLRTVVLQQLLATLRLRDLMQFVIDADRQLDDEYEAINAYVNSLMDEDPQTLC